MPLFSKLLIIISTFFCFVSFSMCQTPPVLSAQKIDEKKCSPIIEGFQFCTTTPNISVKWGDQVPIDLSIQNMTDQNATIIHGSFYDYYKVVVKDSEGNEIPSIKQILAKKDTPLTPEELNQWWFSMESRHAPRKILLAPQETYKVQFSFDLFYHFQTKGKFYIEMSRIIPKQDGTGSAEISFGTIEVEIK